MSFECDASDFVSVSTLAWTVYKSCKDAPESFNNISLEVLSLHAVLKEGEEVLTVQSYPLDQKSRLDTVLGGCHSVLEDLRKLVEKYESLGTQTRRSKCSPRFCPSIRRLRKDAIIKGAERESPLHTILCTSENVAIR